MMALASATLTCFLLFLNGSLVMAILAAVAAAGPSWTSKPEFSQFMLFLMPVVLVVVQWLMIDYVRTRFQQRSPDRVSE
ncbi:MAG: hypothetical protein MI861_03420 [Pirellulales bacterium]|nr:hypothetical protein [Pirellulales bacterium]